MDPVVRRAIEASVGFAPWCGWSSWSDDELVAVVRFRVERAGDVPGMAYEIVMADIEARKAAKKAKKRGGR